MIIFHQIRLLAAHSWQKIQGEQHTDLVLVLTDPLGRILCTSDTRVPIVRHGDSLRRVRGKEGTIPER